MVDTSSLCLHIVVVVAGGAGRHSSIIPSFGETSLSVTKPILDGNGKAP